MLYYNRLIIMYNKGVFKLVYIFIIIALKVLDGYPLSYVSKNSYSMRHHISFKQESDLLPEIVVHSICAKELFGTLARSRSQFQVFFYQPFYTSRT